MTSTRVSRSQGTATAAKNSSGDSPSPPGSQDSEEGKDRVSKLAEHMKKEMQGRREKRRTDIRKAHTESMEKIKDTMILKLDNIQRQMTQRHKLRIEKLCDLIQRRITIESNLIATSKRIDDAFIFADQALEYAINRRLQTIEGYDRTSARD